MNNTGNRLNNNPIYQTKPIAKAKPGYGFVSSDEVLRAFEAQGWVVETTKYSRTRKPERMGFQQHEVWLRNDSLPAIPGLSKNNESVPRICLINSHDLTSALTLRLGVMRMACLNQIVAGNIFRYFRAVHNKNITKKINEGLEYVMQGIPELVSNIQRLQGVTLTPEQQDKFTRTLFDARLNGVKNKLFVDYRALAQRHEDREVDAYTFLNRIQEYIIRGGIKYQYMKTIKHDDGIDQDIVVNGTTRQMNSIPQQMKLGKLLFSEMNNLIAA